MRIEFPATPIAVDTGPRDATFECARITPKRCRCHSSEMYASLVRCRNCRHWSYDRWAGSCERHQCGYEGPE